MVFEGIPRLRVREGFHPPIALSAQPPARMLWSVEVAQPFDSGWSKNRVWRKGKGRTFLATGARQRRSALAEALRLRLSAVGAIPRQNRLWLAVHVSKANHLGDALNVLDLVADGIQDATGIDDRWYSLSGLTWDLVPNRPELRVWIGQEDLPDAAACRRCGAIWSLPGPDRPNVADCPACRGGRSPRPRKPRRRPDRVACPSMPMPGDPPPW